MVNFEDAQARRRIIMAARDKPGGWSREQLAKWNIPWPTPHNWLETMLLHGHPVDVLKLSDKPEE